MMVQIKENRVKAMGNYKQTFYNKAMKASPQTTVQIESRQPHHDALLYEKYSPDNRWKFLGGTVGGPPVSDMKNTHQHTQAHPINTSNYYLAL